MRVSRASEIVLYSFAIAILLVGLRLCRLVPYQSPLPRESIAYKRSLPVSLMTAPEGAIGYHQPPSGPAADQTKPFKTFGVLPNPTTTSAREMAHELRGARAEQNQVIITGRYVCPLHYAPRELMSSFAAGLHLSMS